MTMTPYEPNPAKAISECKGDINKLAMQAEIAKSAFMSALIHIENLLNTPPNTIAHINFALARQFLSSAKFKNGEPSEVHKCASVFTELHLASVVALLERQGTENLNSTDALILRRAKEHVHAIQHRETHNAA